MLDNTIFVFGSNTAGRHGKGAALYAVTHRGAKYGVGEGLHGQSYALPTKNGAIETRTIEEIKESVERFKVFASENPQLTFQVTRVGCGLAGLSDEDVFPMFRDAPSNCWLPGIWEAKRSGVQRLLVAGSRTFDDYEMMRSNLDAWIAEWGLKKPVIVSGTARGADKLGERYAAERSLEIASFPAPWNTLGRAAGPLRNTQMAWYSTHAAVFWDGSSSGSKHMFKTAKESRLRTKMITFTLAPSLAPSDYKSYKGI
jgi:hypothetical protein